MKPALSVILFTVLSGAGLGPLALVGLIDLGAAPVARDAHQYDRLTVSVLRAFASHGCGVLRVDAASRASRQCVALATRGAARRGYRARPCSRWCFSRWRCFVVATVASTFVGSPRRSRWRVGLARVDDALLHGDDLRGPEAYPPMAYGARSGALVCSAHASGAVMVVRILRPGSGATWVACRWCPVRRRLLVKLEYWRFVGDTSGP